MRAALDIALKDLRQRMRDGSAIVLAVVAPFAIAVVFAIILGDAEGEFHADWALADLDGGEVSTALIEGPLARLEAAGVVTLHPEPDGASARTAVADGRVGTAVIIPESFSASVASGAATSVEIVTSSDAGISAQLARTVLQGFIREVEAVGLAVATTLAAEGSDPDPDTSGRLVARARELPDPIELREDLAADRTAPASTYFAAAMSILFVFFGAQFGVVSLLTERRTRTLSRMLAAPIHPVSIVVGKVLVSLVAAVVSLSIIVVGTALLLGARWGDPIAMAVLILAAAVAATGIALLATGLARTEDQAGTAVAIVTITLAILGGAFFPVSQSPEIMARVSLVTPHAWYIRGVTDISTGGSLASSGAAILVLLAIGLVSGALGFVRARRMLVA